MIKRVIKTAKIYGWPSKTFSCKNNAEYARHTLNETASGKCRDSVVMDRHAKKKKTSNKPLDREVYFQKDRHIVIHCALHAENLTCKLQDKMLCDYFIYMCKMSKKAKVLFCSER